MQGFWPTNYKVAAYLKTLRVSDRSARATNEGEARQLIDSMLRKYSFVLRVIFALTAVGTLPSGPRI
jgi:hypothetical protein